MAKIFLLAGQGIKGIPTEVREWLMTYAKQGHEFIVGDTKADGQFHNAIAAFGGKDSCTIYSMGTPNNNVFNIKTREFDTFFDSEEHVARVVESGTDKVLLEIPNIQEESFIKESDSWYKFKDRLMSDECTVAIIVLPDGVEMTKRVHSIIQTLSIKNKPRYIFKV